jgi:hypothetical protein
MAVWDYLSVAISQVLICSRPALEKDHSLSNEDVSHAYGKLKTNLPEQSIFLTPKQDPDLASTLQGAHW